MLPREFANKRGRTVNVRVGRAIPCDRLCRLVGCEDDADARITRYLRLRTSLLRDRPNRPRKRPPLFWSKDPTRRQEALIAPVAPELLADEIAKLPLEALLLQSGEFDVIESPAQAMVGEFVGQGQGLGGSRHVQGHDETFGERNFGHGKN